jgi:ankyrin repeat protein
MQEYFERSQKRWFVNTEDDITITCIMYLSFSTFESGLCRTDKEFEERLQSNQFYNYTACNWGYHARTVFPTLSTLVLMFLESEAKVEASSQVIMASRLYSIHSQYQWDSQRIPRQIKAVHLAAFFGLSEAMKRLLACRHCPNLKDTYNRTPLWYAASNGHENVIKVLLGENGVDPDCKDNYGQTPLSWAAEKGHEVVVKQLLANDRVNPNFKDPFHRQTALWRAADKGHEKVVKLLFKEGADPDCKDKYGQTPLLTAIGRRHNAVMKAFFESGVRLKDIKLLEAPLWAAAKNKDTAMIQALLENGFDLEKENNEGQTPLSYAAANGHEGVVTLLLEKGAELETKNEYIGWTPLSYAAQNGHEAVVKLLLGKGAELETKDEGYGQMQRIAMRWW